ncbi:dihydrofolate reductase family protein [Dactylosporangium sp. NPDC049742]|uniref:dihydrofolate reductase family protein n=1 Tax=Dactylosporangium sp. NPDC049742 TaxID=3154737 RepID=UPI00342ED942
MRKVVLYELLSLDGIAEEPGNWMFDVDQHVFDNLSRIISSQDAVLMGRGTYDYWVDYWPSSDIEPFASFINHTTKHVVTSSQPAKQWNDTVLVDAPVTDYVSGLKLQNGGDIGIHGSISLAQSLLEAGLVDELRLVITPTLAHDGRRLFDHKDALRRLTLLDAQSTPSGHLLLAYRPLPT